MGFTTTERGNRKGKQKTVSWRFLKKNLANDVTSWECEKRRRRECKAKIKLDEARNFMERINNHTIHHLQQSAR